MRVLITGGAGFIGSQIARAHVERGDEVVVVDSLVGGCRDYVPPEARFCQMDIRDPALREVFEREQPQVVSHQAAQVSVSVSTREPLLDAETNVLGTLRVATLALESGVERLVFASTGGALYGEPDRLPADEATPLRPLSPYGCAKAAAEGYLELYRRLGGLCACSLRYSNVYGPRQDPHGEAGVVAIFARALLDGRTATIFGDGEQTRDFVFVEDVVRANLLAADSRAEGPFNIGTGVGTTVSAIYKTLAALTGSSAQPAYAPPREGDVLHITLACGAAREGLGWWPSVTIEEGLEATARWFRDRGL